jgi:MFS family permease
MTPDFGVFLLQVGDTAYLAGLALMAVLSWAAGRRVRRHERVPMQWGLAGKPLWRLGRRGALMFSPVLAALCGLILTWQAHQLPPIASQAALNLAVIRAGMALALVLAHALHLAVAVAAVERERDRGSGPPTR